MTARLVELCIDANDPMLLARFWAAALGWEIGGASHDEVELLATDGAPLSLLFLRVPEPKVGKNRIHLDLTTTSLDDQRDTVDLLLELGGRHLDIGQSPHDDHVVLADPEGNELCVIGPANTFLSNTGRLGAINADGTRRTGLFWSEVLGWPLVWDRDDETAIRAPDLTGPLITWSGAPLIPKHAKNRWHLDIAAIDPADQQSEVERILGLGGAKVDIGQGEVTWEVMVDPDDNEFCVLRRGGS